MMVRALSFIVLFCERPERMNYKELAERADYFKEALINSAHHLDASFLPAFCRQILHIAFAMRPVCLLNRTEKSMPI